MMIVVKTLIAAVIVLIAALVFIYSGIYNVAADEPHLGITERVFQTVRIKSIEARTDNIVVPDDLRSAERIRRGAQGYAAMCQECHLAPGVEPTPLYEGLNPKAPVLNHAVAHGTEYVFWTIKHGIKMTGMPAWGVTHGDGELWDITAFLHELPKLSAAEYAALTEGAEAHDHSAHGAGETHGEHHETHEAAEEPVGEQPKTEPAPSGNPKGHEGHNHAH